MDTSLLPFVWTLIAAGGGAYFGTYLSKKGENAATREDIDGLVQQVAAVTQTTKAIEAQISNEVWDRQRRWELKKEAVFEAVRELASTRAALTNLTSTYVATHRPGLKDTDPNAQLQRFSDSTTRAEALAEYGKANVSFERASMLASVTCGHGVMAKFHAVEVLITKTAIATMELKTPSEAFAGLPDLIIAIAHLVDAIRVDLGVDQPAARSSTT